MMTPLPQRGFKQTSPVIHDRVRREKVKSEK